LRVPLRDFTRNIERAAERLAIDDALWHVLVNRRNLFA
jgi:hypothetical protein